MARFIWRVARKGYRWTADDYLFAPEGSGFRPYEPLEKYTGLFRIFAETPITKKGVLGFANKFGHLGTGAGGVGGDIDDEWERWSEDDWRRVDRTENDALPDMEDLDFWCDQIMQMRECIGTWDKVQSSKADENAMQRLQESVANNLRGRVRVVFGRDARVDGFLLKIKPNTLLGALWLQLAESISGCKKHRACRHCGSWFSILREKINKKSKKKQMMRQNRIYCSEKCKGAAARLRKTKAQQLAREGKTPEEIASELGSDVKTVRGWLMAEP
jgi:hypothetical protein